MRKHKKKKTTNNEPSLFLAFAIFLLKLVLFILKYSFKGIKSLRHGLNYIVLIVGSIISVFTIICVSNGFFYLYNLVTLLLLFNWLFILIILGLLYDKGIFIPKVNKHLKHTQTMQHDDIENTINLVKEDGIWVMR